jgi:uncharacterized protein YndB with AHSA1/START domain
LRHLSSRTALCLSNWELRKYGCWPIIANTRGISPAGSWPGSPIAAEVTGDCTNERLILFALKSWRARFDHPAACCSSRFACQCSGVSSTRISRRVNAPRANVYRALLDARAVATWMAPTGMTCHVHAFDPREGGSFRISLTYDEPTGTGKTTAHTDTYHGRFVKLVINEQVVELVEFETTDPDLRGEMTITISLADGDGGGTDVLAVHDALPPACRLPTTRSAGERQSRNSQRLSRRTKTNASGRAVGKRTTWLKRVTRCLSLSSASRGRKPCPELRRRKEGV